MNKTKTKVDPGEWYNLQDIGRNKMFPWAKGRWAILNAVALDRRNKNILKATITGTGRGSKYRFQGKNIIAFVQAFEAGKAGL